MMDKISTYLTAFIYALIRYAIVFLVSEVMRIHMFPSLGIQINQILNFTIFCALLYAGDVYMKCYEKEEGS